MLWYFANGRSDLSEAPPQGSPRDWRRAYLRGLQDVLTAIAGTVSPTGVRLLVIGDDFEPGTLRTGM